jgi:hypothetical protein
MTAKRCVLHSHTASRWAMALAAPLEAQCVPATPQHLPRAARAARLDLLPCLHLERGHDSPLHSTCKCKGIKGMSG